MQILEKFLISPPRGGRWVFKHPVSSTTFTSHQLNALKDSIWRHERSNGYEASSDEDIERQLCQTHPAACGSNPPRDHETRQLHMADIVRGTKVIFKFKKAGSPLVSQQEANRRAHICSTCKKNVNYSKPCSGICQELIDLVEGIVGGAKTPYDNDLKACAICACSNAAQIHVPIEFLKEGVTEQMMAEFEQVPDCWKASALRELQGAPA